MKKMIDLGQTVIPFPNKKYSIIYADPPWNYQNKGVNGAASKHYYCPTFSELKSLPVSELAEKDCLLFLWATYPMLKEALELIEVWGFSYRTVAFTWVKQNIRSDDFFVGLGSWTRGNPEICLLAKKGAPKRVSKAVRQLVVSKREEHSKKPAEVRDRIVELCGDLPRIELFARQKTPGWDVWGNEV